MKTKIKYVIQDKEAGNIIDKFSSLKDAEKELNEYEQSDKEDGIFEPDFYKIQEVEAWSQNLNNLNPLQLTTS